MNIQAKKWKNNKSKNKFMLRSNPFKRVKIFLESHNIILTFSF